MPDRFETDRLRMRPMTREDDGLIAQLNSDGEVMRYITGRGLTADESARETEDARGKTWLVFNAGDGSFLGWVGAVPMPEADFDIGWRFVRSSWGNGYATEAARALIDELFAEGARRVVANTMAVNERSRAVMERLGLRYLRTFQLEFDDPLPGTELGEVEYGMTRSEWETRRDLAS